MPLGTVAARAQTSITTPMTFRLLWVATRPNAFDADAIAVAAELQRRDHGIAVVAPDGDALSTTARTAGVAFASLHVASRFGGALQRRVLQRRYRPDAVLAADDAAAAWGRQVVAADAVLGPEAALTAVTAVATDVTDRIALRRTLRLPRRPLLVLHVAPLAIGQRHEALLRALAALRQNGAALPTLAFLGTGPAESDLHVLAQDLGVKDHVLWLGFRQDASPYIGACDILVPA